MAHKVLLLLPLLVLAAPAFLLLAVAVLLLVALAQPGAVGAATRVSAGYAHAAVGAATP